MRWCVIAFVACVAAATSHAQASPGIRWLRGDNSAMDPTRVSAPISRRVTNDATLTRNATFAQSSDINDLRLEVGDLSPTAVIDSMLLESLQTDGSVRDRQSLSWVRGQGAVRSSFVRLVGDDIDRSAAGSELHTLRVAVGDGVRASVSIDGQLHQSVLRVGLIAAAPGDTVLWGKVRALILRQTPRGLPVIGRDDASAIEIVRRQIVGASETWLQCLVAFTPPGVADVAVVDPPPAALLAIGDEDGLPALGQGVLRVRANGVHVDAGVTRAGATPVETGLQLARALVKAGFSAVVTENPTTEMGAGASADVLVRDRHGALVALSAWDGQPLSTDRRQTVVVGAVDLGDGLAEFNNMTATAGSLEERTLIKALADADPTTIDLFVVNRFAFGTRQGEAFIENGGGPIANVIVLDRVGLRQQRTAFTLPHEIGHVLLNQPYHPDNVGPDAPWLLMDSDSNAGTVTGPKRITADECDRVRAQSADSLPRLLQPAPAHVPASTPARAARR